MDEGSTGWSANAYDAPVNHIIGRAFDVDESAASARHQATSEPTPAVAPAGFVAAKTTGADLEALAQTGQRSVGETTKVAQELQKHQGGLFPTVTRGLNPNTEGQKILNEILSNSGTTRSSVTSGNHFKGGVRFIDPSGRGATFDSNGIFQYFGEYP